MTDHKAQLLAVEAKLAKDPNNEDLLSLKEDLIELIELSSEFEQTEATTSASTTTKTRTTEPAKPSTSVNETEPSTSPKEVETNVVSKKRKERHKKKKAKTREKVDIAEAERQSWQSFASKKGLKGVTKKSIFASPCSITGKVGVGTNGIADAPSAAGAVKRKY